ncbi:hypothetical protein BAE42_30885 [Mesorhizobium loti]|nr:hypothetical protein BAE42_30885 [Mesorhizobium loti]OBQ68010.1 hypothetical protein A8146_11435 [Mesorhizobium loti]
MPCTASIAGSGVPVSAAILKDFALLVINISNDIGHNSAKELLTATHIDIRRAPGGLQVGGNAGEIGSWGCMFDLSGLD